MQKPVSGKGRSTSRSTGPTAPQRKPRTEARRFLGLPVPVAIILAILLLGGGGTAIVIALSHAAAGNPSGAQLEDALKKAAYYAGKGEFEEALQILNTLNFDNPKVKAALDDVLARKKAADDTAKQGELAALKAQQDQLKTSLAQLGDSLKNRQQQIVV